MLLAIAPSSAIDVFVQKSRVRGILKGVGEGGYLLHYVLKNAEVNQGDHIVTAGIGGVLEPSVDFQRLEFVQLNLSLQQSLIQGKIDSSGG